MSMDNQGEGAGDGSHATNGGKKNTLEFHPLADLFPLIEGADFARLVADIRENGIHDGIVMLDGKILDGRNRYRAGLEASIFPTELDWKTEGLFVEFDGAGVSGGPSGDPLAWVLSKNLHRRHLSASQRAMIAGKIANMKSGARTDLLAAGEKKPRANLPEVSNAEAAEQLKVSHGSVKSAKKVIEHGTPELQAAVTRGDVAVSAAAEIATLPLDEQVEAIESADPKAFARVAKARRDEKTQEKKQRRAEREAELGKKQLSLPDKRFGVILTDDEWEHEPWSDAGLAKAAVNHYPISSLDELKQRDVAGLAARDCVLFMWSTVPHLAQAIELMVHRGFEYKTQCIWNKQYNGARHGMGYWFWINHEILLVGTRGAIPAPAPGTQWPSVIEAPVGRHSEKPEIFHQLIEQYFPSLPKIELNARKPRAGWCAWGNEIQGGGAGEGPNGADGGLKNDEGAGQPVGARQKINDGGVEKIPPESFKPPSRPEAASPASPPISTRVDIGELRMLVRFAEGRVKFYATQKDQSFPAESGVVDVASPPSAKPDATNISRLAAEIWENIFGGGAGEGPNGADGGLKNDGAAGEAVTAEPPKVGAGFGTRRSAKRETNGGAKKTSQEFIPSTIYTMGRTGPVPVSGGGDKEKSGGRK